MPTYTPKQVISAVKANNYDEIEKLLNEEVNLNVEDPRTGYTALIIAINNNNFNMVKLLLDKGADVNCIDKQGWTPLMRAAKSKNIELVKLLLDRGADVKLKNKGGVTALMIAINNKDLAMVDLLLGHDRDPSIQSDSGMTTLSIAIKNRDPQMVDLLLKSYNDVNALNQIKDMVLQEARKQGHQGILRLLTDKWPDAFAATNSTYLDLSARQVRSHHATINRLSTTNVSGLLDNASSTYTHTYSEAAGDASLSPAATTYDSSSLNTENTISRSPQIQTEELNKLTMLQKLRTLLNPNRTAIKKYSPQSKQGKYIISPQKKMEELKQQAEQELKELLPDLLQESVTLNYPDNPYYYTNDPTASIFDHDTINNLPNISGGYKAHPITRGKLYERYKKTASPHLDVLLLLISRTKDTNLVIEKIHKEYISEYQPNDPISTLEKDSDRKNKAQQAIDAILANNTPVLKELGLISTTNAEDDLLFNKIKKLVNDFQKLNTKSDTSIDANNSSNNGFLLRRWRMR